MDELEEAEVSDTELEEYLNLDEEKYEVSAVVTDQSDAEYDYGNASRKFLDEPGWEDYERQPWRSERARELDRLGGMERATIKRGDSFNQKMKFLGASAGSQANHMETVLRGSVDSGTGKPRVARGLAHHDSAKMAVNASLLAQYRDPASWQSPAPVSPPHHQQLRTSASHNPTSSSVSVASSGRVSNGGGGNGGLSKQNSVRERSSLDADATRVAAGIRADNTASDQNSAQGSAEFDYST
eukprot:gene20149-26881_t